MSKQILVIEDDSVLRGLIIGHLEREGYDCAAADSWRAAHSWLAEHEPGLIVMDVRLPDGNSLDHLDELADSYPTIVLTAFGSVRSAVDAIKAGASDYLLKPLSLDELTLTVQRVLENAALRRDHQFCKRQLQAQQGRSSQLLGNSAGMQRLRETIEAVAPNDITVLIQGESGSGKELIARAIHDASERAERAFVAVDCCSLQENLFESELFGHERGAFTGATQQKKGLIEGADGGTLFLDEIGEITPAIQAKLLRVLETGRFRRLGGTKDLSARVRILAATNRDLEQMIAEGEFRADLYYRLCAFNIVSPPLRERREDIPLLAEHFLRNHSFSCRVNKTFTPASLRKMVAYDWPGNVRELKNIVERAIILSGKRPTIRPEHLVFRQNGAAREHHLTLGFDHDPTLEELEAEYLALQLKKYSGRRSKVAEVLGISERSIYRMIKRYGLMEAG